MNDVEDERGAGPGTLSVWAGEEERSWHGAVTVPIAQSVTFAYDDLEAWHEVATGRRPGHIYSRNTNPTVRPFEEKLAALSGAEDATSFATGMAAISNTLFALLSPGQRVVSLRDTYGGTHKIFIEFLPRFGVQVELCPTTDHEAVERAIAAGCDLVYLESPTNPTLEIVDIERLTTAAHAAGAFVVVDNTFATPINQRPLALGADLVIESATKFLSGHSDVMGGALAGRAELVHRVFHFREINGASLHPHSAYLLLRGMKTLELRIARQNANAQRIAEHLVEHPAVERVAYPGLSTHPGHDIARRQMSGFGGMLSFALKGGFNAVRRVLPRLRYAHRAASLGSVGTLVGPPRTTSHVELSAEERAAAGIPEGLIRYSAGIENVEDLLADLDRALAEV